jgi:DNA polymerase III subunit beta
MNISIEKKEFYEAVHNAARFAERKNATLPALSSVLIIAGDDGIKMRATNLETGIDLKIKGTIISEGVVAIPAHILQQIAGSLTQEGSVTLEHTGDLISLGAGMGKSVVKTVPYDDFPSIPFPENPQNSFALPGTLLKTIFTTLASCASTSTVRPELSSISISIEGGVLTAVATDSFRLAEKKVPLANKGIQGKFLIPAKNALDIAQALPDSEVQMLFDEHQCAFVGEGGTIVSRLTNAVYPDYRQIIPKEFVAEAVILRKDFESALKRTTIFADTFQKVHVSLNAKKSNLTFFAKNADIGESSETVSGKISGETIDLAFNHRYLSAVLPLTHAESLSLKASGVGRPLIIAGVGDTSLLYLISPMNQ